jgi:hypothetical protein
MSYTVNWEDDALEALAAVWLQAPDQRAVAIAQSRIDRMLAADPLGNGEPASEGFYTVESGPLRALFEILDQDRVVKVVNVSLLI